MHSTARGTVATTVCTVLVGSWLILAASLSGGIGAEPFAEPAADPAIADTVVLTHGSIVSMTRDSILRDWTLVLASGEIVRMGPTGTVSVPADAEILDLDGRYVLPGLIDAHVHLREPTPGLALFPANWVTTVVNLEGQPEHLALRDSVLEHDAFAPRILTSGPFIDEIVDSPAQARREVERQGAAGYDLIKIHGEMTEGAFAATVDEADRLRLPVVAHHPDNLATETVLAGGLEALAHAEELLGSSLLERPTDLAPDSVTRIARTVAESGTALVTTLGFFTGMRDQATDRFYQMINQPELAYVSPDRRREWLYDGHREYIDDSELPWYDTAVALLHRITGAMHKVGGTVIAGTDTPLEFTIPGFSLHRELEHLVTAGLTPREALHAATVAPADLLGLPELGRIEVGATADLLILDADPTASLTALDHPRALVLRGRWYPGTAVKRKLDELAATYARDQVALSARQRVQETILALLRTGDTAAAWAEMSRISDNDGAPRLTESDLNDLGYRLLEEDDLQGAIEVFRLNVRLHPSSANVHDSLGEAYLAADRLEAAERSYRKALDLDPTMDSARRGLRAIAEKRDLRSRHSGEDDVQVTSV